MFAIHPPSNLAAFASALSHSDENYARFINHACEPNCEAVMEGDRIFIEAIKSIRVGEELILGDGAGSVASRNAPCSSFVNAPKKRRVEPFFWSSCRSCGVKSLS